MQYLPPPNMDKVLAIGVGTAGCRMLSNLESEKIHVDNYAYISCEKNDMDCSSLGKKLFIDSGFVGQNIPSNIRGTAQRYEKEIRRILSGSRLVFLVGGLGGATGSGLIPLIGEIAKEEGVLTISIIAMPFSFEKSKHFYAGISIKNVRRNSDAVIIIDNDMISSYKDQMSISHFYSIINERIAIALSKIADSTGELSVGMNRMVDTILNDGYSILSIGTSSSINRVEEATVRAAESIFPVAEPEEASKVILYLLGDQRLGPNEFMISTSRLNTMLGNGGLQVQLGFSSNSSNTITAILLASGFKSTKFDDYDPLSKILHDRSIDFDMESCIDKQLLNLRQLE